MTSILFVIVRIYLNQLMQLSKNQKTFSQFFTEFLHHILNILKKKHDPRSLNIFKITDCKTRD